MALPDELGVDVLPIDVDPPDDPTIPIAILLDDPDLPLEHEIRECLLGPTARGLTLLRRVDLSKSDLELNALVCDAKGIAVGDPGDRALIGGADDGWVADAGGKQAQ